MAGGINAAVVPCLQCVERADRISEGQENDYYRCSSCGYKFGIDWSHNGQPQKPCWPISEEEAAERKKMAAQMFGIMSGNKADSSTGNIAAPKQPTKPWWKFW